ncbi:MAG: hypothetical protein MK081_01295 [Flavobacteriales bacterium]|nr:hypothetical protein [Flavobacteriales bacterium]
MQKAPCLLPIILLTGYLYAQILEQHFAKTTVLTVSSPLDVIKENDSYFTPEGEYALIFKTSPAQIERWLKAQPTQLSKWHTGSVNCQIGFHCSFGVGLLR